MGKGTDRRRKQALESLRNLSDFDEEINLLLRLSKEIEAKVNKSVTIKNDKGMIREKEGVSEDVQELSFSGDQLEDEHKIIDYGISKNSAINQWITALTKINLVERELSMIKLYFECSRMPSEKQNLELDVHRNDTIETIKSIIEAKEGNPLDEYEYAIYHGVKYLESWETVASLNIQNGGKLEVIYTLKKMLSFFVETPIRGTIKVKVERSKATPLDVKRIVESKLNITGGKYELFKGEVQLENCMTLYYYNEVKDNDTLKMLFRAPYEISVKLVNGDTVILQVTQLDTLRDIHERLFKLTGVPGDLQGIIFRAKTLNNISRNLAFYEIGKESMLCMLRRRRGGA